MLADRKTRVAENWRIVGVAAIVGTVGVVAWQGSVAPIGISAIIPVVMFRQRRRSDAFLVAIVYYASASWPMIPGVRQYFYPASKFLYSTLLWLLASVLLTVPWVLCWTARQTAAVWRLPLAYVLSVVPPIGIIGWASPLTTAGIAFPGWGWSGLLVFVGLSAAACIAPVRIAVSAAALVLIANATQPGAPHAPKGWEGVQTNFNFTPYASDPNPEFESAQTVQRIALRSPNQVLIFPEFIVPRWTEATQFFWEGTIHAAKAGGKTLLIGTGLTIPRTERYHNSVLILGAQGGAPSFQRIPVPLVMWNPLTPDRGVPLDLFSPGIVNVNGERAAVLICYEQLLTWPILRSAIAHPTLILGLANDRWANSTPIPAAQRAAVTAWARLFNLPQILAVNL